MAIERNKSCGLLAVLVVSTLVMWQSGPVGAESPKRRDVRTLLNLSGAGNMGEQMKSQLVASMRPMAPNVSEEYWANLNKSLDTKGLLNQLITVYERHLTHADIKGLIKFYKSPVGKKFVKVQPKIVQDSMKIGQSWGQQVSLRVAEDLKKLEKGESPRSRPSQLTPSKK